MADLNMNDRLTQYELAKRGGIKDALVIELFNCEDELNIDVPHIPCNHGQLHEVILSDTYPEAEFHGYHMGAGHAATQVRSKSEGLCYAEIFAKVDKKLADDSGNAAAYRSDEDQRFIKGLGRQKSTVSIYGDKNKNPYEIDGLYTRLKNAKNPHVIPFVKTADLDGTENCTSLYMCAFGRDKFHYIFSTTFGNAGVKHEDLGVELVSDLPRANGKTDGMGRVYVGHYEMEFGIAIEHPDSVWRIANIPTNPAWWDKAKRERFIDTVIETQDYLPPGAMTKGLYGNIRAKQILEKAGRETQVVVFSEKDPWGNPVSLVNGMRLRRVDVIKCGETV